MEKVASREKSRLVENGLKKIIKCSLYVSLRMTPYHLIHQSAPNSRCMYKSKYKKVGVLPIRKLFLFLFLRKLFLFLRKQFRQRETDEGPMLETLDYTIRIGSTPTFLYFDLYL